MDNLGVHRPLIQVDRHHGHGLKKDLLDNGNPEFDDQNIMDNFNAAGGVGILHKDINETLAKLRTLLD